MNASPPARALLRGVNLSNRSKYSPDHLYPLEPSDLAMLRESGLNSVRLLTFWEAVMPGPDVVDVPYLAAYAAQAGALLERDRLTAKAADATRLREGENARRALLAAVSHDLRTPIAGIKAAISTLADEQLSLSVEDRRLLLEAAEQGTDRLALLVWFIWTAQVA